MTEEGVIAINAEISSTNSTFQNPIAPFTMELRSQDRTSTTTGRDLYYTAKEIRKEVSEIEEGEDIDLEDEVEQQFDTNLKGDFCDGTNKMLFNRKRRELCRLHLSKILS